MNTGENEQGLRKILDMTRMMAISIIILHFYFYWYRAFESWELTSDISDRLLKNIQGTGLFSSFNKSKIISLVILIISMLGARGKKNEKLGFKPVFVYLIAGLILFFGSQILLSIQQPLITTDIIYITVTTIGFISILTGGTLCSRILQLRLRNDIFNKENETFRCV